MTYLDSLRTYDAYARWRLYLLALSAFLLFFANIPLVYEIRISHLIIFFSLLSVLICYRYRYSEYAFIFISILLGGISIIYYLKCDLFCHRIVSDSTKLLLLILGSVYVCRLAKGNIQHVFIILVPISVFSVLWNYQYGDWGYYDAVRMRFGIPMLGSPNSTAYVLSFLVIASLVLAKNEPNRIKHFFWLVSSAVLTSAITLSQSRGGILLLFIGLISVFKFNRYTLLVLFLVSVAAIIYINPEHFQRMNIIEEVATTGGARRIDIWSELIMAWLDTPISFLFGYGPGSINIHLYDPQYTQESLVISAHSSFIASIRWFGLIGLMISFVYLGTLLWRMQSTSNPMIKGFSAMMFVSFFIDSYLFDANILLVNILLLSYVILCKSDNKDLLAIS